MAFRYKLQSILRLRQSFERLEEQRLLALAAEVASLRNTIEAIDGYRLTEGRQRLEQMTRGASGAELQFALVCDGRLAQRRTHVEKQLQDAEKRRLEQLQRYNAARQKREILEGLRNRQQANYEIEAARREQQRIDEAFLLRTFLENREASFGNDLAQ